MAKIEGRPTVKMEVCLQLTEAEAGALDALVGYGIDPFLEVFYKLGRAYMEPYEDGLRSLFESVRTGEGSVRGLLEKARDAREVFTGTKVAVHRPREGKS